MATHHQNQETYEEHSQQDSSFMLDAALYCAEEKWGEHEEEENGNRNRSEVVTSSFPQLFLLEQDLFWEDEELITLFQKEEQQMKQTHFGINVVEYKDGGFTSLARGDAVGWMLKVNAHYGFTTLTAVLAINYLDRFLCCFELQEDKPWMVQLVAVTCLSLAAKVEETQVPLLLDLQVEETKYLFEAKTIQRMELLVLSTLQWKMHPVTPLSFVDHITRRLGLKSNLHWEFRRRCEVLLLSVVSDSRFVGYLPSILATATMMHIIDQVEPFNSLNYQNHLLSILNITKEQVNNCYELILLQQQQQKSSRKQVNNIFTQKRKYYHEESAQTSSMSSSPSGVIGASVFSCNDNSSNHSWGLESTEPPLKKKSRTQDQQLRLPSHNRVFLDIVASP